MKEPKDITVFDITGRMAPNLGAALREGLVRRYGGDVLEAKLTMLKDRKELEQVMLACKGVGWATVLNFYVAVDVIWREIAGLKPRVLNPLELTPEERKKPRPKVRIDGEVYDPSNFEDEFSWCVDLVQNKHFT